jgi:hypothetical protein
MIFPAAKLHFWGIVPAKHVSLLLKSLYNILGLSHDYPH